MPEPLARLGHWALAASDPTRVGTQGAARTYQSFLVSGNVHETKVIAGFRHQHGSVTSMYVGGDMVVAGIYTMTSDKLATSKMVQRSNLPSSVCPFGLFRMGKRIWRQAI